MECSVTAKVAKDDGIEKCQNCCSALGEVKRRRTKLILSSSLSKKEIPIMKALVYIFDLSNNIFIFGLTQLIGKACPNLISPQFKNLSIVLCKECAALLSDIYQAHVAFNNSSQPIVKLAAKRCANSMDNFETKDSNCSDEGDFNFDSQENMQSEEEIDIKYDPLQTEDGETELKAQLTDDRFTTSVSPAPGLENEKDAFGKRQSQLRRANIKKHIRRIHVKHEDGIVWTESVDESPKKSTLLPSEDEESVDAKDSISSDPDYTINNEKLKTSPANILDAKRRPSKITRRSYTHRRLEIAKNNTSLACDKCGKSYSCRSSLYSHVYIKHSRVAKKEDEKCPECRKSVVNLSDHIKLYHEKNYNCDVCGKQYKCMGSFLTHRNIKHFGYVPPKRKRSQCSICGKHVISLKTHMNVHSDNPLKYVCPICGKKFAVQQYLVQHHKLVHLGERQRKRKDTCPVCGKSVWMLKDHMNTHAENPTRFQCTMCDKEFLSKYSVENHKRVSHFGYKAPKVTHTCVICGKGVLFIKAHMKTHDERKLYECEKCDKIFQTENSLRIHSRQKHISTIPPDHPEAQQCSTCGEYVSDMATHMKMHDDVVAQCDQCGKILSSKSSLATHKKLHAEKGKYVCQFCGKSFSSHYVLSAHEPIHHNERPYSCLLCSQTFKTKSSMRHHKVTHSDARPYVCDICGQSFKRISPYHIHKRCHEDEQKGRDSFVCEQCNRNFKHRHSLEMHVRRTHNAKQTSFECMTCGKVFRYARGLKRHHREKHRLEPVAESLNIKTEKQNDKQPL